MVSYVKNFLSESLETVSFLSGGGYGILFGLISACLLAISIKFFAKPFLRRFRIEKDRNFFISLLPFVFLTGYSISLKETYGSLELAIFLVVVTVIATSISIIVAKKIEHYQNIAYYRTNLFIGAIVLSIASILYLEFIPKIILQIIQVSLPWTIPLLITYKLGIQFEYILAIAAHLFDAITTVVAVNNGYREMHILGRLFIENLGPKGIIAMKLIFIPVILYTLERLKLEKNTKKSVLFLITYLGIIAATNNISVLLH